MNHVYSYFRKLAIAFLIFQLSIPISVSQSEQTQPKCDNNQIQYSIFADMASYLEKENNIDERELYSSIDDLKSKKVWTISILKIDDSFKDVVYYKNYDELISDLRKHKVDGILVDSFSANYTQIFTNDLSVIQGNAGNIKPTLAVQKNSQLYQDFGQFYAQNSQELYLIFNKWIRINDIGNKIDKTLTGNKGVIKASSIYLPPFAYKDENGETTGLEVEILYMFARAYDYKLDIQLKDVESADELFKSLEDGSVDIISCFDQGQDLSKFSVFQSDNIEIKPTIRYFNHPNSPEWKMFDAPKQFDGEDLGCLEGYSFEYLYNDNFPNAKLTYYTDNYDMLYDLLLEEIEGFLTDDIVGKNFEKKYPDRITYYDMNVSNEFGFGFKKDNNTSNLKVDKETFANGKTIKVGIQLDTKPFSFIEENEQKGYELDLLYQFAKNKEYNIDLVELKNAEERMNIGNYDITGGSFTITEDRAKTVSFSKPIFKLGTAFVVRADSKKDKIKLEIYDNEYNKKSDNKATVLATIGDKKVTSDCSFPDTFNDTFQINCTINDFNGTDPYTQGIEYVNTTDKLRILYSDLEIDNILKANDKLGLPIIQESDKTEKICSKENQTDKNIKPIKRKNRRGLSAGGIIAIILPCAVAVVAVVAIAMAMKKQTVSAPMQPDSVNIPIQS